MLLMHSNLRPLFLIISYHFNIVFKICKALFWGSCSQISHPSYVRQNSAPALVTKTEARSRQVVCAKQYFSGRILPLWIPCYFLTLVYQGGAIFRGKSHCCSSIITNIAIYNIKMTLIIYWGVLKIAPPWYSKG